MGRQRRDKGGGSLTEVRPGVWRLRVYLGTDPQTGHPRQASRTVHGGHREAGRALRAMVSEFESHPERDRSVGRLLAEWLTHLRRVGRAPSTLESYETHTRLHLVPAIGHVRVGDLTAKHLDDLYAALQDAGASAGSIRLTHATISAALAQAVRWRWIGYNPAASSTPPRREAASDEVLTPEQVRALVDGAEGDDPDLAMAIVLAAITGARRGELCGLRWSDLDAEAGILSIRRSVVRLASGMVIGPPKSGRERKVAIGREGVAILARYRGLVEERCAQLEVEPDWDGWLLSVDGGRSPMHPRRLSERARSLGERVGIPVHLHALRHYSASQLVGAGVDIRTAAGRLGHSPEVMLRVYAHRLPERDRAAAGLLEGLVLGAAPEEAN